MTQAGGRQGGDGGAGRWGGGLRFKPVVHPEMKWVIECRINTANNLGSSPFEKRKREEKIVRKCVCVCWGRGVG